MMSACPSGRDQRQSGLTAHEMPALGFFLLCFGGVLVPGSSDEYRKTKTGKMPASMRMTERVEQTPKRGQTLMP